MLECCWVLGGPDRNVSRKKAGKMSPRIPCGKERISWLTVTFLLFAKLCWAISVWATNCGRLSNRTELTGPQLCEPLGWRPLARSLELWSWVQLFLISLLWPQSCQKSSLFLGREYVQSSKEVEPKINIAAVLRYLLREKTFRKAYLASLGAPEVYQYCSSAIPSASLPIYWGCPLLTVHAGAQSLTMP